MTSENTHRALYSGIAEWYVRTFYSDFSDIDWLKLFAQVLPDHAVIADIGCGPGQFAQFFRRLGHPALSMDLAERMLEQGKLLDRELVPVVADISHIPLRNSAIGGILAAYTLEHIRRAEIDAVLWELARVIQPGGALALMVKCGTGFYEFRSSLVEGARGYVQLWELGELSKLVSTAGFETIFIDQKAPTSPEEFDHERGFLLARRLLS